MNKDIRKVITKRNGTRSVITTLYGTEGKKSVKLSSGRATCNKLDSFDFEEGERISKERAMNKYNRTYKEIGVGDVVRVIDPDECYPTYLGWVKKNIPQYLGNFVFNRVPGTESVHPCYEKYRVIQIAPHENFGIMVYAIEDLSSFEVYIISGEGLDKVN